ncbi:MAG: GNAT family N-acetyltransferase [Oscillospiraceae bacterium]|nr:GNAT family N-acetyltransferase [Oscillospiraceae bacterium]
MITIRELTGDDIESAGLITNASGRFTPDAVDIIENARIEREAGLDTLAYGLMHGKTMVGVVTLRADDRRDTLSVCEFLIGDAYKRRGFGKAAMLAVVGFAAANGYRGLDLAVHASNAAKRLFESVGFYPTGGFSAEAFELMTLTLGAKR